MTKWEIEHDQVMEGRERKAQEDEPNIHYIDEIEIEYVDYKTPGTVGAKIIGAYFNNSWHRYMHCAYHIVHADGSRDTILAKSVVRYKR
jgi:hypothetical protein